MYKNAPNWAKMSSPDMCSTVSPWMMERCSPFFVKKKNDIAAWQLYLTLRVVDFPLLSWHLTHHITRHLTPQCVERETLPASRTFCTIHANPIFLSRIHMPIFWCFPENAPFICRSELLPPPAPFSVGMSLGGWLRDPLILKKKSHHPNNFWCLHQRPQRLVH